MLHRRGLSRVELLVILAIIGLLAGIVLIAFGLLRDSSNAMHCKNNLKQLGLGIHNYHDTTGELPPLADQGERTQTGRGLPSVFANLAPYLEATAYVFRPREPAENYHGHSSLEFTYRDKLGTTFTVDGGMANRSWKILSDPADATAEQLRDVPIPLPDGTTGYYATGSYAANGRLAWGDRIGPGSPPHWMPAPSCSPSVPRSAAPRLVKTSTTCGASASTARTCRPSRC